ncbi:hypothetical protein ABID31_002233 [Chryseobacterium flavum]
MIFAVLLSGAVITTTTTFRFCLAAGFLHGLGIEAILRN